MEFRLWSRRNIDSLTVGPSASRAALTESTRALSKAFLASSPKFYGTPTTSLTKIQGNSEGTTEIRVTLLSATRRSHLHFNCGKSRVQVHSKKGLLCRETSVHTLIFWRV